MKKETILLAEDEENDVLLVKAEADSDGNAGAGLKSEAPKGLKEIGRRKSEIVLDFQSTVA